MLTFDPDDRITVPQALEHPWLSSYHDVDDEPSCPKTFEKWRHIEELETLEDFREALWNEIEDYRREVRGISDLSGQPIHTTSVSSGSRSSARHRSPSIPTRSEALPESEVIMEEPGGETITEEGTTLVSPDAPITQIDDTGPASELKEGAEKEGAAPPAVRRRTVTSDPVVTYARRSSILQPSRQGSTYNSPGPMHQRPPSFSEGAVVEEPGSLLPQGSIAFPSQGYVVPARSRTGSTVGGEYTRKLLRTLSTVSIHESAKGLPGGLGEIAPIGKFIVEGQTTGADAPPSEMPREFVTETSEPYSDEGSDDDVGEGKEAKKKKFLVG